MKKRFSTRVLGAACGSLLITAPAAHAVIVYGSQGNNFVPATPVPVTTNGLPLDQYEGGIDGFLGTAISSKYFVTANHITGNPTGTFSYRNGTNTSTNYAVVRVGVKDDLAIWEISPATPTAVFADWAPLYTGSNELNQSLLVLGLGTARGSAVTGGWAYGAAATSGSWGTNVVSATPDATDIGAPDGFGGSYLQYTFYNNSSNPNEAITSTGDSGGGVFVRDPADGVYKLAGVNSLVDSVLDSSGNAVSAALYDDYGYYTRDQDNNLVQISTHDPLSSYATRISSRLDFIDSVTGVPEPGGGTVIIGAAALAARRRSRCGAHGDHVAG